MGAVLIPRAVGAAVAAALAVAPTLADTVVRRDGVRLEGRVVAVDADWVVLDDGGGTRRVDRGEVVSILFASRDSPPPVRVEVRIVRADDAVDVILDGDTVLREARASTSWTDLTGRLKEGNQSLRLRIRNDRGPWSYRVHVRINGEIHALECGDAKRPCDCCDATGYEIGWIEDVPPVWIHVDRGLGRVEIQR